jgi:hypothetical protein
LPICLATNAACAVRPPTAVTIPAAVAKPATSAVVVSGRTKNDRVAASCEARRAVGIECGAADSDARRCARAVADRLRCDHQAFVDQRTQIHAVEPAQTFGRGDPSLLHEIDGQP